MPHLGILLIGHFTLASERMEDETWRSLPEWKRQVLKNRIMKEQSAELEKRKKVSTKYQAEEFDDMSGRIRKVFGKNR